MPPASRRRIPLWSGAGRNDASPVLAAVAANAAAGTLFAWSVMLPALSGQVGRRAVELGPVFSTALAVFAIAVLISGESVDHYGPRRATLAGGLLCGGGLLIASCSANVASLHLGIGLLFGFGSGLTYLSTVSYASSRSGSHRSWLVGLVVASYAAGPMVVAPLAGPSADLLGSRATLAVAAMGIGVVIVVASRGLPGPPDLSRGVAVVSLEAAEDGAAAAALWCVALGAFVPGLFGFAYAADIATEQGVSRQGAGVTVALMAAANLTGRILGAPLSERVGLRRAMAFSLASAALALALLARLPATSSVVAMTGLALLGGQYGLMSVLLPLATREMHGESGFAAAYGRVFSAWGCAGLLGPAVGAALYREALGYVRSCEAMLVGVMLASVALMVYHHLVPRPRD